MLARVGNEPACRLSLFINSLLRSNAAWLSASALVHVCLCVCVRGMNSLSDDWDGYQASVVDSLNTLPRNSHSHTFPSFPGCVAMVTGVHVEFYPGIRISVLYHFHPVGSETGQRS